MKTSREKNSNTFSGQIQEKIDFTVSKKNVNKIINILRSSMYKEPERAVVREILANALDIHKQTGTTKKIDVSLPSRFNNNNWIVRDYGTGLSPDEIKTIYTSFGESTKDQADDAIGGFGVGCKSPFSYTDSYMVNSYYNGKKYQYLMSIGDDDSSECRLVLTTDTKEPNGLEVKVPVNPDHVRRFSSLTIETLFFWDRKHYRVDQNDTLIKEPTVEIGGKKWKRYAEIRNCVPSYAANSRMFDRRNCTINVGGMPYLLDTNAISSGLKKEEASFINSISEGLHVDLDISEVDLPVNREDLRYTDRTKKNLLKVFRDIKQNYLSKIEGKIAQAKSLEEALESFYASSKYAEYNCRWSYNRGPDGIDRITYEALVSSGLKWKNIELSKLFNGYKLHSSYRTITKDVDFPNRVKITDYGAMSSVSTWVNLVNRNDTITWNLPPLANEPTLKTLKRKTLHVYQDYETKVFPPGTKQAVYDWAKKNGYGFVQFIVSNKQEDWNTFLKENPELKEMTNVIHRASVVAPKQASAKKVASKKRAMIGKDDDRVIEVECLDFGNYIKIEDNTADYIAHCYAPRENRNGVLIDFNTERHSIKELKKMSQNKKYVGYFVKTKQSVNEAFFDPTVYLADNWNGIWGPSSYTYGTLSKNRKLHGHYTGMIKALNLGLIYCGLEKEIIKEDDIIIYGVKPQHEKYIKKIPGIQNPKDIFEEIYNTKIKPNLKKTLKKAKNKLYSDTKDIKLNIFDILHRERTNITILWGLSVGFGKEKEFLLNYPKFKELIENTEDNNSSDHSEKTKEIKRVFETKYTLLNGLAYAFKDYKQPKTGDYSTEVYGEVQKAKSVVSSNATSCTISLDSREVRTLAAIDQVLHYTDRWQLEKFNNKNDTKVNGENHARRLINKSSDTTAKGILSEYIVNYYKSL